MTQGYDPRRHHRRSIRLKGWDYTSPGVYFVTICTYQHQNLFDDKQCRQVVEKAWQAIPSHPHARNIKLDQWVVMPNHLHGIIFIADTPSSHVPEQGEATGPEGESKHAGSSLVAPPLRNAPAGSLGAIVGNFKSVVTRRLNRLRNTPGEKVWQRGYYERIVRNERELNAIRKYIWDNPCRWSEDRENLDEIIARMYMIR
jgi:REP element-mobilizing transposase RayT